MEKILISACLLGEKVRYDGKAKTLASSCIETWQQQGRVIPLCPEVAGGLTTPRPPAEQQQHLVITNNGIDVTRQFNKGAEIALQLCKQHKIKFALLKANSPSCGNQTIYDGSFTGTIVSGQGVTARLLTSHHIQVFNEGQLQQLITALEANQE